MRKLIPAVAVAIVAAALVVLGTAALAAKPKRNTFYSDSKTNTTLQTDDQRNINNFNGGCTKKHAKYTFSYIWGIKVKKGGKFHASHQNAVNTPDGGTLEKTSKVTISGKFVSRNEAKGSYRLHKHGCKTIKFDAKA